MELEILGARPNPVDGATGVCTAAFQFWASSVGGFEI